MAPKETVGIFMVFIPIQNFRISISNVQCDFTITAEGKYRFFTANMLFYILWNTTFIKKSVAMQHFQPWHEMMLAHIPPYSAVILVLFMAGN